MDEEAHLEPTALSAAVAVEVPVSAAREMLADLINKAAYTEQITYLTRRGRRVAAVVPVQVASRAEQLESTETALGADVPGPV